VQVTSRGGPARLTTQGDQVRKLQSTQPSLQEHLVQNSKIQSFDISAENSYSEATVSALMPTLRKSIPKIILEHDTQNVASRNAAVGTTQTQTLRPVLKGLEDLNLKGIKVRGSMQRLSVTQHQVPNSD